MKPYGNNRRDNAMCAYGCCSGCRVRSRYTTPTHAVRRVRRKTARQEAQREITEIGQEAKSR